MESLNPLFSGCMTLNEEHIYFGGMNLTYRLIAYTKNGISFFRVCVIKNEESDEAELGCDLLRAVEHYRMIVRGSVTPCALQDVIRELSYA